MSISDTKHIFYVTRDGERGIFCSDHISGCHLVANDFSYLNGHSNVFAKKGKKVMSTRELLLDDEVEEYIKDQSGNNTPKIVVFKNTPQIEGICAERGWELLNPPAELVENVENKMTQRDILQEIGVLVPESMVGVLGELTYGDVVDTLGGHFVLQYNRSHTGQGTILITDEGQWSEQVDKFPKRDVKLSALIAGESFTVNAVADTKGGVVMGNVSYQITGVDALTKFSFATVGNDWFVGAQLIASVQGDMKNIVKKIGSYLSSKGWRGMFGVDVVMGEGGKLYLIEINARQPQSATCESYLQGAGDSILEVHLQALQGERIGKKEVPVVSGAQIFVRNKKETAEYGMGLQAGVYSYEDDDAQRVGDGLSVADAGYGSYYVFAAGKKGEYKENSELARIQSKEGLVDSEGELSEEVEDMAGALRVKIK